jgi:hypothetical protein
MRGLKVLFVILPVLMLFGCFEYDLNGDAYVVKGAGDINPVAGQKVYLLPYENEIDFLYEAATSAYGVASSQLASELEPLCKKGLEIAGNKKEEINKELSKIKNKKTVPQEGCVSIQSSIDSLANKTESIKNEYDSKVSVLKGKLSKLQASKKQKVSEDAKKIEKSVNNKVKIKFLGQGGNESYQIAYRYAFDVINDTDFCVSINRVDVMYNDYVIYEVSKYFFSDIKDEYGFDTECDVLPQTTRKYRYADIITSKIDSPEKNMMLAEGKIKRFNGSDYPEINKLSIDYKLTRMSSKKTEGKVKYYHSGVSYNDLAEKNNKYDEDSEIAELNKSISKLKESHESNKEIKEQIGLENILAECKKDEAAISEKEKTISQLEGIVSSTSSCGNGGNVAGAVSAIEKLNENYGAKIELPEIQEMYAKEAFVLLAKKMSESLQAKTTIQGAYEFQKLKKGKYLLYTEYSDNFNSGFWLKPIEISDNMKVDLTNDEMVFAPFTDYVNIQLQSACKSCSVDEFRKSVNSRSEVVQTYKERKELLEHLQERLRDLQRQLN